MPSGSPDASISTAPQKHPPVYVAIDGLRLRGRHVYGNNRSGSQTTFFHGFREVNSFTRAALDPRTSLMTGTRNDRLSWTSARAMREPSSLRGGFHHDQDRLHRGRRRTTGRARPREHGGRSPKVEPPP